MLLFRWLSLLKNQSRRDGVGHLAMCELPVAIEHLEDRMMLSGDGIADDVAFDLRDLADEAILGDEESAAYRSALVQESSRNEIAFVDTGIDGYETLLDDLRQQTEAQQFDIFLIDSRRDGIEQISEVLAEYVDLNGVHIFSHGSANGLQLGSTWLDKTFVGQNGKEITQWSDSFSADADLLVYGCELASSAQGTYLLHQLATLTGADVAASNDLTGANNLGGDWELEFRTGTIETAPLGAAYQGLLLFTASLDANGNLQIDDTTGTPDNIAVQTTLNQEFQITDNTGNQITTVIVGAMGDGTPAEPLLIPFASVGANATIRVSSAGGDDTITIGPFDAGGPLFNVEVDGGGGANDQVNLGAVNTRGGTITVQNANSLTVNQKIISGGGAVTFNLNDGVTLTGANADIDTGGADYNVDADNDNTSTGTYTQDNTDSVVGTGGGSANIKAADVVLTGKIDSGAGSTNFGASGSATPIALGGTVVGSLSLTDAELDNISTSASIAVATPNAGVSFVGAVSMANADSLHIMSGTTVNDFGPADAFTDLSLAINAQTGIGTTSPFNMAVSNFAAHTQGGNIVLDNTGNMIITSVATVVGVISVDNGDVQMVGSSISVNQPVRVRGMGHIVTIDAEGGAGANVAINSVVSTTDGLLAIVADDSIVGLATGRVETTSGQVDLTADKDNDGTGTIMFAGTLEIGSTGANVNVAENNGTIDGIISGAGGSLTKTGAGELALGGTNSYSGGTNVNAGTLLANNVLGNGTITVAAGATFGGIGMAGGSVDAQGGGTVAPGTSPGTLHINDSVNLSNATFAVELGSTTSFDQLEVDGDGGTTLNNTTLNVTLNFTPSVGDTFTIIESGGGVQGTFNNLIEGTSFTSGVADFTITYIGGGGSDVILTVVSVDNINFFFNNRLGGSSPTVVPTSFVVFDPETDSSETSTSSSESASDSGADGETTVETSTSSGNIIQEAVSAFTLIFNSNFSATFDFSATFVDVSPGDEPLGDIEAPDLPEFEPEALWLPESDDSLIPPETAMLAELSDDGFSFPADDREDLFTEAGDGEVNTLLDLLRKLRERLAKLTDWVFQTAVEGPDVAPDFEPNKTTNEGAAK